MYTRCTVTTLRLKMWYARWFLFSLVVTFLSLNRSLLWCFLPHFRTYGVVTAVFYLFMFIFVDKTWVSIFFFLSVQHSWSRYTNILFVSNWMLLLLFLSNSTLHIMSQQFCQKICKWKKKSSSNNIIFCILLSASFLKTGDTICQHTKIQSVSNTTQLVSTLL